jgi:uncharacterized DUF497 family protein
MAVTPIHRLSRRGFQQQLKLIVLTLYIRIDMIIMDVEYRFNGINFVWDRMKARLNLRKHGVAFETACEIFFDPFVTLTGKEIVRGEERESAIGMTGDWKLLKVVYVFRPAFVRLISARTVTIHEIKNYEEQ